MCSAAGDVICCRCERRQPIPIRATPTSRGSARDQVLIGFAEPLSSPDATRAVAERGATLFAMELMPRITRAQSMDALSSMATIAGYKAVLIAASTLPRMFPDAHDRGRHDRAGHACSSWAPASPASRRSRPRAGWARKSRPTTCGRRSRSRCRASARSSSRCRSKTADAEDKGGYAKAQDEAFYRRQREMMQKVVAANDVVITTALVPGRKAPMLVTGEMVAGMQPGSVIVDLAAERGGNCELTEPDRTVVKHGVTILGPDQSARRPCRTTPARCIRRTSRHFCCTC